MKHSKHLEAHIKEHNQKVKSEFERAARGEVICLTDLMISKEKIQEQMIEEEAAQKRLKADSNGKGDESHE